MKNKIQFKKRPMRVGKTSLCFLVDKYFRDKIGLSLDEEYIVTVERNGE